MKYLQFTLLILLGFNLTAFGLHKYYVSVMEIHPNYKEKKLEIILRTFPDDMQTTMEDYQKKTNKKLDFDQFVKDYIKQKIRFAINGQEKNYRILGMTTEDNYLVILMEVPFDKESQLKTIHIENEFLLDEFDQQKNIIHFLSKDKKKSYILDKKNRLLKISL